MSYHDAMNDARRKELQDEGWFRCYHDYFQRLSRGFYKQWYVDMIMQTSYQSPIDIYQAAHFANIHAAIFSGKVFYTTIAPTQTTPYGDAEIGLNNQALMNLTHPFEAQFKGGPGIGDGTLQWSEPIILDGTYDGDALPPKSIAPGWAMLEVGYTKPTTTLYHLARSRRLARWPYGHNAIYLLVVVDRDLWTVKFPYVRKKLRQEYEQLELTRTPPPSPGE